MRLLLTIILAFATLTAQDRSKNTYNDKLTGCTFTWKIKTAKSGLRFIGTVKNNGKSDYANVIFTFLLYDAEDEPVHKQMVSITSLPVGESKDIFELVKIDAKKIRYAKIQNVIAG